MRSVRLDGTFEAWRDAARRLLELGVGPERVAFVDASGQDLLPGLVNEPASDYTPCRRRPLHVPAAFVALGGKVAAHRDPARWARLYRVLWRLAGGEARILEDPTDPDVAALRAMEHAVEADVHRIHALVRFREQRDGGEGGGPRYLAFHRPDHRTLALAAPFFVRRFAAMRWSILTPDGSAHWDGARLELAAGAPRDPVGPDGLEELWRTYYASTFNPGRVNPRLLRSHLPGRFWATLPELQAARPLVRGAAAELAAMAERARAPVPEGLDLAGLARAARACGACSLCARATAPVFGEGPGHARIALVGEQPGDAEDRAGRPFVGPAGEVLDAALAASGLDRRRLYVTNAVKAFKHELRGKRRIHQRPDPGEIAACGPWLAAELRAVRPAAVVALGATAARALLGPGFARERGRVVPGPLGAAAVATWHPAALLRAPDPARARAMRAELEAHLALAAAAAARGGPA